jgi:hypothetical protein
MSQFVVEGGTRSRGPCQIAKSNFCSAVLVFYAVSNEFEFGAHLGFRILFEAKTEWVRFVTRAEGESTYKWAQGESTYLRAPRRHVGHR